MKHKKTVLLLIIATLIFPGCREKDPVLEDLIINKKNYPNYIEEIRRGYTGRWQMPGDLWRPNLQDLLIYQEHLKDELYGDNEEQYLYDRAMTLLVIHEFIDSFELFNEYIELTGKRGDVYYQINKNFYLMDRHGSSSVVVNYVIKEILDGSFDPSYQQQIDFLKIVDSDFVTVLKKIELTEDVRESEIYKSYLASWHTAFNKLAIPEEKMEFINFFSLPERFPYDMIQEIENQQSHSSYDIDFLIRYYVDVYNQDFEKAAEWADKRNIVVEQVDHRELPGLRIQNMMKAYIGAQRYDEALNVFEQNSYKLNDLRMSQERFNLLLAVCYAGKNELDTALEFLEKDVEVTEILEYHNKRDSIGPQLKGSMIQTLFEYYFVFDEFKNFNKANRYEEVRDIFEEGLNRYRHLEVFSRVK